MSLLENACKSILPWGMHVPWKKGDHSCSVKKNGNATPWWKDLHTYVCFSKHYGAHREGFRRENRIPFCPKPFRLPPWASFWENSWIAKNFAGDRDVVFGLIFRKREKKTLFWFPWFFYLRLWLGSCGVMREADRPFRPKHSPTVQVKQTETLTHRSGYINQPDSPCESR